MVTETFGDVLYYSGSDTITEYPSPESLKKRIIVSTKPPKEYLDKTNSMEKNDEESSVKMKTSPEDDPWGVEICNPIEKHKSLNEVGNYIYSFFFLQFTTIIYKNLI